MNPENKESLSQQYLIARVIYFSMLAAIFMYGIIAHLAKPAASQQASSGIVPLTLIAVAIMQVISSWPLKTWLLSQRKSAGQPGNAAALLTASLVSWASCEAAAVIGLIVYFQTGNLVSFYSLAILALGALAAHFPKYHEWKDAAGPETR